VLIKPAIAAPLILRASSILSLRLKEHLYELRQPACASVGRQAGWEHGK